MYPTKETSSFALNAKEELSADLGNLGAQGLQWNWANGLGFALEVEAQEFRVEGSFFPA